MQEARYKSKSKKNSHPNNREIKIYSKISNEAEDNLLYSAKKLNMTARGVCKTIKVSRTIADMEKSTKIHTKHVLEAISYRL